MQQYLEATPTIDFDHPTVAGFTEEACGDAVDSRDIAVRLFYAVRDGVRYDPYSIRFSLEGLRASETLRTGRGWCVPKAVLLAACCRLKGIPARLGYADVRNHLSTERLRRTMKTDVFYWHGYTAIFLGGRWLKATPAFNAELCEKFRMLPVNFDGKEDSLYHPVDRDGNRHMQYLNFRGEFADVPVESIRKTFLRHYPGIRTLVEQDFDADVEREP